MEKIDLSNAKLEASASAISEFKEDGFGMSVHWGLYSILAKHEWIMFQEKIPVKEYEKLMLRFNPVLFDAEEWVSLIKEAGMRSLLITSKHHDGFCMFDTKLTDYKVTNTPFKRDPLAELAKACHRYGIKLHFYYSLLDWRHPDYLSNWDSYVKYYQGQIRELCTNYGKLGGILFDGWWPRMKFGPEQEHFLPRGDWDLTGTYDLIHSLQPDAMVTNNHHILPLQGEDYQIFELDLPGENTTGFNTTEIGDKPLATWQTMNKSWCYNKDDKEFKSVKDITKYLIECRKKGVYLHLNVGPMANGKFQVEEIERLKGIGEALSKIK